MKSVLILLISAFLLASAQKGVRAPLDQARHYVVTKDYEVIEIDPQDALNAFESSENVVVASYLDDLQNSGWIYLTVNTSSSYPDVVQASAAGYFEGYQAYEYIYNTYINEGPYVRGDPLKLELLDWVDRQRVWYTAQIEANPNDTFWQLANISLSQHIGIYNGFIDAITANNASQYFLTYEQFYLISYSWDLLDVSVLFKPSPGVPQEKLHCSFLLKLVEDDLYFSHTTWAWFEIMIKMFKTYNYGYTNPAIKNNMVVYSSQPGAIESGDDYYILNNNRFVGETTLGSSNPRSWDFLHIESVPYFIRINIANLAWETQEQWAQYYFSYRSGTYNNQWIVIDLNQYEKYQDNLDEATDIVWYIEEFYGMTSAEDVTQTLLVSHGYAASYNEVWNPVLQAYSMNPDNYTNAPRYFLFEKYAPNIQNFEMFQDVMRMNNFSDMHNYSYAIASRFDLIPASDGAFPFGAIDAKASAYSMAADMEAYIIAGPTTELTPPFSWDNWPNYVNCSLGQPRTFNFTWQHVVPWSSSNEL